LLDTDVFVDHLRAAKRVPVDPNDSSYSTITRAELYAGRNTDESIVDRLLGPFREIPVDREIAEEAGRIRRGTALPLPDALIASTAMANNLILVTRNKKHFKTIKGLRLYE